MAMKDEQPQDHQQPAPHVDEFIRLQTEAVYRESRLSALASIAPMPQAAGERARGERRLSERRHNREHRQTGQRALDGTTLPQPAVPQRRHNERRQGLDRRLAS